MSVLYSLPLSSLFAYFYVELYENEVAWNTHFTGNVLCYFSGGNRIINLLAYLLFGFLVENVAPTLPARLQKKFPSYSADCVHRRSFAISLHCVQIYDRQNTSSSSFAAFALFRLEFNYIYIYIVGNFIIIEKNTNTPTTIGLLVTSLQDRF